MVHCAVASMCVGLGLVSVAYFAGFHAYGWCVVCLWGEVHVCVNSGVCNGASDL